MNKDNAKEWNNTSVMSVLVIYGMTKWFIMEQDVDCLKLSERFCPRKSVPEPLQTKDYIKEMTIIWR